MMTERQTVARSLARALRMQEFKRERSIEILGRKWLLHPANRVRRLPQPLDSSSSPLGEDDPGDSLPAESSEIAAHAWQFSEVAPAKAAKAQTQVEDRVTGGHN